MKGESRGSTLSRPGALAVNRGLSGGLERALRSDLDIQAHARVPLGHVRGELGHLTSGVRVKGHLEHVLLFFSRAVRDGTPPGPFHNGRKSARHLLQTSVSCAMSSRYQIRELGNQARFLCTRAQDRSQSAQDSAPIEGRPPSAMPQPAGAAWVGDVRASPSGTTLIPAGNARKYCGFTTSRPILKSDRSLETGRHSESPHPP